MIEFDKSMYGSLTADDGHTCICPQHISIPAARYEELIRAETERNVLEAIIESGQSYRADDVLNAIKKARVLAAKQVITVTIPEEEKGDAE